MHTHFFQSVYLKCSSRQVEKPEMRISKKHCIIGVIITYGFLIMLFFVLKKEETIETPCNWDQPCVRFCCKDMALCKDEFIRKNFKHNFTTYDNETVEFIILHGAPTCTLKDRGTEDPIITQVSLLRIV